MFAQDDGVRRWRDQGHAHKQGQTLLVWRKHSDSAPTFAVLKSHTVAQSMLDGNIQTGLKHYPDAQNPEAERVKYS